MKRPTTSDQLKLVFETVLQSKAGDWKRGPKSKNEDGQWVREFENKQTGEQIAVIEMEDGYYNIKGKDINANIRLPQQFRKASATAAATGLSTPDIAYAPIANEAADKAIAIIMGDEPRADKSEGPAEWGVPKTVLDDAGKALANRHCFAISADGEMLAAMITPIRYFKEEGCCSDQSGPVRHLLPRCSEVMESSWGSCDPKIRKPEDFAKYLQAQGFQWSRDFQNYIDRRLTAKLGKTIAAMEDAASPGQAAPAKPQSPKR